MATPSREPGVSMEDVESCIRKCMESYTKLQAIFSRTDGSDPLTAMVAKQELTETMGFLMDAVRRFPEGPTKALVQGALDDLLPFLRSLELEALDCPS